MWPRVVEVMLGCWLIASPLIFRHEPSAQFLWWNDITCGFAVIVLSFLSFWRPMRHAHLLVCLIAVWLIVFGFLTWPAPASAALQNNVGVGFLLLLFAILPNEINRPPESWRKLASPSPRS